ncbi:MAG TPA: PKD domain-containing protein [Planctomycetota bacterium]|nr:PKD domain-containing protein [Planctomycetota bacterium]
MTPPPIVHASWAMMVLSVLLLAPPIVFIFIARRGRQLYIRRIPGIDAIEEALGRATELGRPIVFTTGMTGLDQLLFAILGVLSHIGKKAAAFGCRLIVPQRDYEVMPVVSETVREAFRSAGRLDAFNPQDIRYLSPEQFAFASGYMGIVHREKAASCFMFGDYAAESLVLAEAGQQVGAMQVAGTVSYNQVPFFLTSCDYTIIGEEVYAAGAYLSRDPAQLGSIRGQDVAKLVVLGTVAAGVVFATAYSSMRSDPREGTKYNSPFSQMLYEQPKQARAVADFEVESAFRPPNAPTAEDLAAGQTSGMPAEWSPADLDQDLGRIRARYGRKAVRAAGMLRGVSADSAALAARLRSGLALVADEAARAEASALAGRLDEVAGRATQESAALRAQHRTDLAALAVDIASRARPRAAELAGLELATLGDWVDDNEKLAGDNGKALVARAQSVVRDNPEADATRIARELRAARQACYRAWFARARAYTLEAERAAEGRTPTFLGNLAPADGGLPLTLDGTRSASGRLMPLSYAWKVSFASGETSEHQGPQVKVPFTKAGDCLVFLKVSEKPSRPRSMVLALLTNEPTDVRHETIAAGTTFNFSWRMPKDARPGSAEISWDFGDGGPVVSGKEGKALAQTHTYADPGSYRMTVEVRYLRDDKPAAAAAAAAAAKAKAGSGTAAPGLMALRADVAAGLTGICDRLAELEECLADMKSDTDEYASRLETFGKLSPEAWPDREKVASLGKTAGELRVWTADQNKALGKSLSAVGTLGAAKPAEPPAGAKPEATPTGDAKPAAGKSSEGIPCWNRFRIYWKVVRPEEHESRMVIRVRDVPEKLPRAPWEPRPKPPEPKPAEAPAAKEAGK